MFSKTLSTLKPVTLSVKPLVLAGDITPLTLFSCFAHQPWAIWLDSGQSKHIDACFDIIAWQPEVTLCTTGKQTKIQHAKTKEIEISNKDPLKLLDTLQQQVLTRLEPDQENIPFMGGALGYFSYDLGRRFEKLPKIAEQDIKVPEMAVGIYSQAVIFDHKKQQFFLVCPPEKRLTIENLLRVKMTSQINSNKTKSTFSLTSNWQSNMNKASYVEKFQQVQDYLSAGDCYQINLSQRFSADYQGNEFLAYQELRKENKAPFSAFMRIDNAAVLSVSPERFLQLRHEKVQSKPIKGTMPRSDDKHQDMKNAISLKNSSKDRAENVMIVDLLRNDIAKVCQPNSVVVPKLFDIESFPAVHHLVSTVEGKLAKEYNAGDLLRGAFPGGSITGAPKIRAMEIIEQLEPHRRSVYCGSIGYLSSCGTMDTSITIRTLVCEQRNDKPTMEQQNSQEQTTGKIYCWAGGGLVADSTADSEYQETFDKVNRILPVLNNFSCTVGE